MDIPFSMRDRLRIAMSDVASTAKPYLNLIRSPSGLIKAWERA
jgi:hypothetical protein